MNKMVLNLSWAADSPCITYTEAGAIYLSWADSPCITYTEAGAYIWAEILGLRCYMM